MRDKFLFVGKFLLFSTLFFILWIGIGWYYLLFLTNIATPILFFMGYPVELITQGEIIFLYMGAEMGLAQAEMTNYNIIPFIALVLATPIPIKKMIRNLGIGIPIIFCFHLINLIAHFPYYFNGDLLASFIISLSAITRLILPFLLWFGLSYDTVLSSFRSKKKIYRCPFCGKATPGILMHIAAVHETTQEYQKKTVEQFIRKYPELYDVN